MKRAAKAGKNKDEFDRLIGVEEVFKSCKEIAKMQIENVLNVRRQQEMQQYVLIVDLMLRDIMMTNKVK